jgi:hypothetical protein
MVGKRQLFEKDEKLSATIQQISATLRLFENQGRIKEAVPVQNYTDPVSEKIEDRLNQVELFEDIVASYSDTQEEVPDDDPGSCNPSIAEQIL